MNRPLLRLLALLVLPASLATAQTARLGAPPARYEPVPPTPAGREALRLHALGCMAEDFDDSVCDKAVRQLEAAARQEPRQLEVQVALADAVWNQSFRQPEGSAERARLRQRSLDLYQRLVDLGIPDAQPYYALSVLTRDVDTRLRLLRRAVQLNPKHPQAHGDLAWLLLERGQTDEAVREHRLHLSASPRQGREAALADLRFAAELTRRERIREAAQVYDALWDALRQEDRAERCQVFQSVDVDPFERIGARFAQRLRELRGACASLEQVEHALELVRQGREGAAIQELERLVQQGAPLAEPYLALQRLFLDKGQAGRAAEVMTRYFQQEKDARERCQHFRTLPPQTARALAPTLREELERACPRAR